MTDTFVVLVNYQGQEYGEVENKVERVKYRIEEWLEHDLTIDEIEILHISNHVVERLIAREFIRKF